MGKAQCGVVVGQAWSLYGPMMARLQSGTRAAARKRQFRGRPPVAVRGQPNVLFEDGTNGTEKT